VSEIFINNARACAVSGHRVLYSDFDRERLEKVFNKLVDGGFDTFLVGMALGFDTECFLILEKIREKKNIKIIACIPCLTQAERFNKKQKELYNKMVESADERIILSQEYTDTCMKKRNEFMVKNSSVLVYYKRREKGGTAQTVNFAKKQNKILLEV